MAETDGMDKELGDWRRAWRGLQEAGSSACPREEALASLAVEDSDLSPEERRTLADHVVSCRRCAALYRDLLDLHREAQRAERPTGPSPTPRSRGTWILAAAAAVAALLLGVWSFWLLGENRRLAGELAAAADREKEAPPARSPQRPAATGAEVQAALGRLAELTRAAEEQTGRIARLEGEIAELSAPRFNVPVIDLDPAGAVARGESGAAPRKVEIPAGAGLVTLILNPAQPPPPGSYALEILTEGAAGAQGNRRVWSGEGLRPTPWENFSLAIPRPLLPDGRFRLRLSTGSGTLVETYEVQIATPAAR